jgi:hypothetical protein
MMNNPTRVIPVVGVGMLLGSMLVAADQDCPHPADCQSPVQSGSADSRTVQTGPESKGKNGRPPGRSGCIVDLKPGDAGLFAHSIQSAGRLHRWFELEAATVGVQYVFAKSGLGLITASRPQYQIALRARVKLDAKGRFSINAGLFTGPSFMAGFNNTGLGAGPAQSAVYLKHLYLSAAPLKGIEIQYGGLNIWHDESTDITGYGYSGYVVGERASIKRPRELFFDDISIFYGYAGDFNTPNVIRRADHLSQSNFHRFILRKDIGERAWVSADYAFHSGIPTWREAVRVHTAELRAIDTLHAEIYQIQRMHSGNGFAAYVEKTIHPKLVLGGGYADVDRLLLNSDRYSSGKRLFLTAKIPISRALSVLVFATQAADHASTNVPQQRIDIGVYYNALDLFSKKRWF